MEVGRKGRGVNGRKGSRVERKKERIGKEREKDRMKMKECKKSKEWREKNGGRDVGAEKGV